MAGSKGSRGGQGATKGRNAISVVFPDGNSMRYEEIGGTIYETSEFMPREIQTSLSLEQMGKNAEAMGATVEKLTDADLQRIEQQNKKFHEEMERLLARQEFSLKRYLTTSKRARGSAR